MAGFVAQSIMNRDRSAGLVRISLKWITDSGDVDHGFR
jgi:hypothetical protein